MILLLLGFAGPTASRLTPPLFDGMPELAEAIRLAPEQRWESAKEALERAGRENAAQISDSSPNRPALSERSKYPPLSFASDAAAPNGAERANGDREVTGFDAATSREIPERREPFERTYANSDGTTTTEFSEGPLNFERPDGTMAPIVTTVVPDGSSPTSGWRNAADSLDLRFSRTAGADGMVRVVFDDAHQLSYGVADAKPVEGRADGSSLTYPGIRPDADVRLDVRPGALKETLVLTSAKAPRSWTFPLRLTGLRAEVVDGRVALLDERDVERARFPRGFMVDSKVDELSGDPARSDAVRYEVVEHDGATALKVEFDSPWLDDPARQYPVLVDPTIEPQAANASMIAQDGFRDTSGAELKAGRVDGTTAASYLKFDGIENRLRNHKIFSSHLALANTHSYSCRPRPITVHGVTEPWGTGGGYPGPAYGDALTEASFAHGREGCPATWEVVNLGTPGRDLVQRWVDGEQANHGLTVRAPVDDVHAWKKFAGHAAGGAAPALYVTYSRYNASYQFLDPRPDPPITRAQGGEVKVSATNLGSGPWTRGDYSLGYRIFTESGSRVSEVENAAPLPKDVARGETVNLEPFVEKLEPGKYTVDFSIVHKGVRVLSDDMLPVLRLVLQVYEIPPRIVDQYPPNGHPSPVLTPSLWAQALDIAPKPGSSLTYNYQLCEKDSAGVDFACTDSGFLPGQTYTVPANRLRWSKTYYWRVTASNGTVQSPPGPQSALLTVVPQPEITSHLAVAPYSGSNKDFDPQTGNYFSSAIDASVATVGPALVVARTYNSLDPRTDLLFGAGWSSTYDMRVVPDQDGSGNVVVTYPDGQQARFGRNGDGTFAPPSGRYATFRQVDGGWSLQDKASTLYTFGGDGRLRAVVDNQRRTVSLAYDAAGRLKTATSDTSRRTLTFTWSGGHIGSVSTEPVGGKALTWTYTYDGDQLTGVCDPNGGCTTYEHSTGSHYRSVVADSNPDSYWRLGETTGEVAVSEGGTRLGEDNGRYTDVGHANAGPLSGTSTRAATFNGTSSVVTLPNELSVKSRSTAIELWFRTTASGPLFAQQRKALGEESTGAVPVLYVGQDGRLRGEFWHGSVNPVTTPEPVNDGQWHHVVLSGSLATQTMYLDGARVGSVDGTIAPEDVPFNQIGAGYAAGSWPQWGPNPRWYFTGDIAEVALYQHPVGDTAVAAHFRARASATQLAGITLPSGRTAATLTYDTVNDRLRESVDENGGLWRIGTPSSSGDGTNPILSVSVTDPGNRFHDYAYDAARGRVVRYSSPLGLGARESDATPAPTTTTTTPTCTTSTPPNGGPVFCGGPVTGPPSWETGPIKGQGVRTFDYDAAGFQNTITNEVGAQVRMTYDERGNLLSSTTCRTSSTDCQTSRTEYFLNAGNSIDPRNDKPVEHRDARSTSATDDTYVVRTTYTPFGETLTRTRPDGSGTSQTYTVDSDAAFGGGNTPAGLVATRTDARGQVTRNSYYRNGDLAEVVAPSGLTTRFAYDVLGRKTSETQISEAHPDGVTTTYTYDALSRPSRVTSPGVRNPITGVTHTSRATTEYDVDGRRTGVEVVDLTGGDQPRASTFDHDAHGRLVRAVDPEGRESSQGYDVFGNVVWSVDPAGNRTELSYTARNQVAEVRLKDWRGDEAAPAGGDLVVQDNAYDHAGRLVVRSDAMGRTLVYTYYQDDKPWKVIATGFHNANGTTRDITLQENTYDAAGALVKQVAGGGQVTTVHEIDALGRVAATTVDPDRVQRRMRYTYDAGDNIVREVRSGRPSNVPFTASASSTVLDHVYDGPGRRVSDSTFADGVALTTSRTYDQRGNVTSSTDPRGNAEGAVAEDFTTRFTYDELGRRVTSTAPAVSVETGGGAPVTANPTTTAGYNTFDQMTDVRDATGAVTRTEYDRLGRRTRAVLPSYTPPGGQPITPTATTTYDVAGNVRTTTDGRDNTTTFTYDQFNRVVRKQDPDVGGAAGGVWSYTYTRTGEQRSVTSPVGARVQATYDDLGRRITTTRLERSPQPTAFTTKYAYDDADNLTSTTSPNDEVAKQVYDTANQLITTIDPAGVTTQHGYDQVGRKITEKDGLGRYTALRFDDAGRQTGVLDFSPSNALLRRTSVDYDPAGNPVARTDALGHTTTATYDALNRQVSQVEPVSATETITTGFGYDAVGHRTRYTDGRGNPTVYTFNSLGLPESVVEPSTQAHPAAADRTWTVAYDAATNAVSATAPGGVTRQRTYDPLNRLTEETGAGAEAATATRSNSYDLAGRLTGVSAPGGTNTFTYNDRGALLTAAGPSGASSFAYDASGRVTERTDAAGTSTYAYYKGRLASVQDGVTGGRQTLGYNAAGDVNQVVYGSGHVRTLDFDDLGRPTADKLRNTAGSVVSSIAYGYDAADNVTGKTTTGTAGAGQNTYTYDHAGRMTSWTGSGRTTTYGWDASGNRTRVDDKTSTFDARNRLLADGDFTYAYTARGTLASRTSSGLTDRMTFDAFDRMVGQGQATYAYDGLDRMVVRNGTRLSYSGAGDALASDGAADYTRGPSGELVALEQGQDKRLAITDMHGDLVGGLAPGDGTAGLADSAAFDPFGKVLGTSGGKRSIGFQGSWTDPDTAQVNMGSRWYDPSTGAFNSRDSVMAASGGSVLFNRYTYGSGSPIRYSDPDGHWGFDWVGDAIDAVGGWVDDNVVQPTKNAASAVAGWASQAWNTVVDWGKRTWNNVVQWASDTWNNVVDWGKRTWNSFVDWGKRTWNTVSEKFSEVLTWGSNALNSILGALESGWTAFSGVLDEISALGEKWVLNPIEDAAKTVFSAIPTIPARVVSMVTDLSVEDAQATIDAAWNSAVQAYPVIGQVGSFLSGAVEAAGGLVEFAWNFTPLRVVLSPSSLFSNIANLYGGLWNGLQDPLAFGKSLVDWDTWATDPARAAGHLVPDVIGAIFTGGGAAVGRRVAVGTAEAAAEAGVRRGAGQVAKDSAKGVVSCKDPNSFLPATLVLMADGTRRAIEDVQVGDLVVATDPTTGTTADKRVTDVIVGDGEKDLVEATVATGAGVGSLTATGDHPFWVNGEGEWVDADELRVGHRLHTADGTPAAVVGLRAYTQVRKVYNLTVDGIHTFYVMAGSTPVLVHNEADSNSDLVYLWRAVTEGELGDILANRQWNSPQGVKYFSFTERGAAEYSRRAFAAFSAEGPYTMIRTSVRLSSLPEETRMAYTADVVDGGVALNNGELKKLGRPSIMTSMSTGVGC